MPISTTSIIHYTDKINKIVSILEHGFAIKYCVEKLHIDIGIVSNAAHPMISFCDIPLSQSHKHFKAYGKYGIGLTKEWARKKGINPVLYLDKSSSISKTFGEFITERRNIKSNLTKQQRKNILRLKCFIKNYDGPLKRKSIDINNYKFYDEREWRFVPESKSIGGANFSIRLSLYKKSKGSYNKAISSFRLDFKPEDITYIIVDTAEEIPIMIKKLREIYEDKLNTTQMDILINKICSTQQIRSDY